LLARAGRRADRSVTIRPGDTTLDEPPFITILDGFVAATSFAMLALMAGTGALTGEALPRSGHAAVVIGYVAMESIVVVTAELIVYHQLIGHTLTPVIFGAAIGLVVLITTRQVVAMGAQRLMTQRLIEAQRGLAHQVLHDPLTGLPNRLLLGERLDKAIHEGP